MESSQLWISIHSRLIPTTPKPLPEPQLLLDYLRPYLHVHHAPLQISIFTLPEDINQNPIYDIDTLRQQVLLLDTSQQMDSYLETEKILAEDPLTQMTSLSRALLQLSRNAMIGQFSEAFTLPRKGPLSPEQLGSIQSQCLSGLLRVQEERRKLETCCICLSSRKKVLIIPCMHLVVCGGCSRMIDRCPICKGFIQRAAEVFQ